MKTYFLTNPFRFFFPLAWGMGIWGGLIWIFFAMGWTAYPVQAHPQSMVVGFLLGHIVGFLLTAGPRFTATGDLKISEFAIAATLYGAVCLSVMLHAPQQTVFALAALTIAALAAILGGRFVRRTKTPPAEFIFLPFGLVAGLLGASGRAFAVDLESEYLTRLSGLFLYEGFVLSLVLGVGGRLAPFLMGHGLEPAASQMELSAKSRLSRLVLPLVIFWLTYLLEATNSPGLASPVSMRLIRAMVVGFILLRDWRIYRLPQAETRQAWGIWISAWMLVSGSLMSVYTDWRIHSIHLFYIGGLGLLTLMVATRVTLAHGSKRLLLERTSRAIYPVVALIIAASLTRFSAGFLPESYISHLAYAGGMWGIALLVWGWVFLREGFYQRLGSADG